MSMLIFACVSALLFVNVTSAQKKSASNRGLFFNFDLGGTTWPISMRRLALSNRVETRAKIDKDEDGSVNHIKNDINRNERESNGPIFDVAKYKEDTERRVNYTETNDKDKELILEKIIIDEKGKDEAPRTKANSSNLEQLKEITELKTRDSVLFRHDTLDEFILPLFNALLKPEEQNNDETSTTYKPPSNENTGSNRKYESKVNFTRKDFKAPRIVGPSRIILAVNATKEIEGEAKQLPKNKGKDENEQPDELEKGDRDEIPKNPPYTKSIVPVNETKEEAKQLPYNEGKDENGQLDELEKAGIGGIPKDLGNIKIIVPVNETKEEAKPLPYNEGKDENGQPNEFEKTDIGGIPKDLGNIKIIEPVNETKEEAKQLPYNEGKDENGQLDELEEADIGGIPKDLENIKIIVSVNETKEEAKQLRYNEGKDENRQLDELKRANIGEIPKDFENIKIIVPVNGTKEEAKQMPYNEGKDENRQPDELEKADIGGILKGLGNIKIIESVNKTKEVEDLKKLSTGEKRGFKENLDEVVSYLKDILVPKSFVYIDDHLIIKGERWRDFDVNINGTKKKFSFATLQGADNKEYGTVQKVTIKRKKSSPGNKEVLVVYEKY